MNQSKSSTKSNDPYSGILWESGQFSVGRNNISFSKEKKIGKIDSDSDLVSGLSPEAIKLFNNYVDLDTTKSEAIQEAYELEMISYPDCIKLLGLLKAAISHIEEKKPKARKGLRGITSLGRSTLENAVVRLDKEVGLDRLSFGTVTFPPMPKEFLECVNATDYRRLEKEWRRRLVRELKKKSGEDPEIILSIEIQEKRLKKSGYPYLHWHFVYVAKKYKGVVNDENPYYLNIDELPQIWAKTVRDWIYQTIRLHKVYLSDSFIDNLNFVPSCSLVKCQDMTAQYLGKYLSKGIDCAERCIDKGFEFMIPYHWWYVSPKLKNRVNAAKIQIPVNEAKDLFLSPENLEAEGLIVSFKIIEVDWNGEAYHVGVGGRLSLLGVEWIKESIRKNQTQLSLL